MSETQFVNAGGVGLHGMFEVLIDSPTRITDLVHHCESLSLEGLNSIITGLIHLVLMKRCFLRVLFVMRVDDDFQNNSEIVFGCFICQVTERLSDKILTLSLCDDSVMINGFSLWPGSGFAPTT